MRGTFFILIGIGVLISSCSFERRLYRDGFYIHRSEARHLLCIDSARTISLNLRSDVLDAQINDTDRIEHNLDSLPDETNERPEIASKETGASDTNNVTGGLGVQEAADQAIISQREAKKLDEWKFAGLAILVAVPGMLGVLMLAELTTAMLLFGYGIILLILVLLALSVRAHFRYRKSNKLDPPISPFRFLARIVLYLLALIGAYFIIGLMSLFQ